MAGTELKISYAWSSVFRKPLKTRFGYLGMPIAATNALLKVLGHTSKQVTDYNFILLNELQKMRIVTKQVTEISKFCENRLNLMQSGF